MPHCERCNRDFRLRRDKKKHIQDSPNHHLCRDCHLDFETSDELFQHDIQEHNMCHVCHAYFETAHGRDTVSVFRSLPSPGLVFIAKRILQHLVAHAPRDVDCPGCDRMFPSSSAMVLHLETGACASNVDCDWVDSVAFECYAAMYYTSDQGGFDFMCPTCQVPFVYMSSVLQHAESNRCEECMTRGSPLWRFLRYLRSRF